MPARKYDYYESWQSSDYEEKLKIDEPKRVVRKKTQYGPAMVKVFGCILLVLCVMVLLIQRYAVISETKYRVFNHKVKIKELELKKEELNARLDSLYVIDNVEKIAMEQLDMQYPSASQMVYIGGESDYTVKEDTQMIQKVEEQEKQFSYIESLRLLPAKFTNVFE